MINFNPRPPRGGRPKGCRKTGTRAKISIHAPREGGDVKHVDKISENFNFNPRPPRGGRRTANVAGMSTLPFQSTPPARGATAAVNEISHIRRISIHAPREGGDAWFCYFFPAFAYFNPRPPRGGRRWGCKGLRPMHRFQSTPPARGATIVCYWQCDQRSFQSTPPARGATWPFGCCMTAYDFNPRPPRGGRQQAQDQDLPGLVISIHAPREGGDFSLVLLHGLLVYFNPRPPRGGRPRRFAGTDIFTTFQSTPPARGATVLCGILFMLIIQFQSTPPARGATSKNFIQVSRLIFQSTPPARGATHTDPAERYPS